MSLDYINTQYTSSTKTIHNLLYKKKIKINKNQTLSYRVFQNSGYSFLKENK